MAIAWIRSKVGSQLELVAEVHLYKVQRERVAAEFAGTLTYDRAVRRARMRQSVRHRGVLQSWLCQSASSSLTVDLLIAFTVFVLSSRLICGIRACLLTHGSRANWHPHLHLLVTRVGLR